MHIRGVVKPDKNEKWNTYACIKLVCVDPADAGLIFGQCVKYLEKKKARFNASVGIIDPCTRDWMLDGQHGFFFADDISETRVTTAATHLDIFDLWVVEIVSIRNTKTLDILCNKIRKFVSQGKCQAYQIKKHDKVFNRAYLKVDGETVKEVKESEIHDES